MANRGKPVRHGSKWRIRWTDTTGARRSAVFDTVAEAEVALARRRLENEEVKLGVRRLVGGRTFGDVCDQWLATRTDKRSLKQDEGMIERHLRPAFGALRLDSVTELHVAKYVSDVRSYLLDSTINKNLTLLSTLLHCAHRLGWLDRVPVIRKPSRGHAESEFQYLRSRDEVDRFLDAARVEGDDVHALYATAVYTGLRIGELAGLHWADVDFDRQLLTVRRSYSGPTKTNDARVVPILDVLVPVLTSWRQRRPCEAIVFPNRAGRMMHHSSPVVDAILRRVLSRAHFPSRERRVQAIVYSFERDSAGHIRLDDTGKVLRRPGRVIERLKVDPYITFHDLRHTFASQWVMSGGDIFRLQKILGHRSVAVTTRYYAHLAPDAFVADRGLLGPGSHAD